MTLIFTPWLDLKYCSLIEIFHYSPPATRYFYIENLTVVWYAVPSAMAAQLYFMVAFCWHYDSCEPPEQRNIPFQNMPTHRLNQHSVGISSRCIGSVRKSSARQAEIQTFTETRNDRMWKQFELGKFMGTSILSNPLSRRSSKSGSNIRANLNELFRSVSRTASSRAR